MAISLMMTNHTSRTHKWSFDNPDNRGAFGRDPRAILPERGLVESQYPRPGPPRNQGVDHLGGSNEFDPEGRIRNSTLNMYVGSDTCEERGLHAGEAEIPRKGLSNDESITHGVMHIPAR